MKNVFKTAFLLVLMTLLLMAVGELVGGPRGMMVALMLAVVLNFVSYWFSDKIVLGIYRARDPQAGEQHLVSLVQNLATQANLPMPRVKVIDMDVPNAFATGRNPHHAVVAATTGILRILNDRELTAVLAHELSHVKNRDILISAVAATLAGAITMIARMTFFFGGDRDRNVLSGLVLLILAPIAAFLIQMAVSRSREFEADRSGGILTNRPLDLAAALEKLQAAAQQRPLASTPATNVTAHLFIVNPFKLQGLAALFSTHPSMTQRVERLKELDQELRGVPKGI
jgi:heat shock protein HtpX